MFIVGRAIAGAGAAGISTGALTIISCVLPIRKQAKALGINMGIGQMGIALGPILGGAFTEAWVFAFKEFVAWMTALGNLPPDAPDDAMEEDPKVRAAGQRVLDARDKAREAFMAGR